MSPNFIHSRYVRNANSIVRGCTYASNSGLDKNRVMSTRGTVRLRVYSGSIRSYFWGTQPPEDFLY